MKLQDAVNLMKNTLFWKNYNDALVCGFKGFKYDNKYYITETVRTALRPQKKPVTPSQANSISLLFN